MTSVRQHKAIVHTDGNVSDYVHLVRNWLDRMSLGDFGHRGTMQDNPSAEPLFPHFLYPRIKELEPRWYEDETRREEILDIFDEMVLQGDEPSNLCATALVTNAYLYTGDEKYKTWVLDYVRGWIDRIEANGGIIPDNVGSHRQGGRGPRWAVVGRPARLERKRTGNRPALPRPHHRRGSALTCSAAVTNRTSKCCGRK